MAPHAIVMKQKGNIFPANTGPSPELAKDVSACILSCGSNTFKYDLRSEDHEGNQDSTVSVFTRDSDGTLRHFYSAHPSMADDIRERGIDLLCPVYNVLDLTPQGRGDWYAELGYGTSVPAAH